MHKKCFCFTAILIVLAVCQLSCKQSQEIETPTKISKEVDEKVIAIVGDTKITVKDKDVLSRLILRPLYKKFVKDNKIEPTEKEIDALVNKLDELTKQDRLKREDERKKLVAELRSGDLDENERKKKESRLKSVERTLKNFQKMEEQSEDVQETSRKQIRKLAQNMVTRRKAYKALYDKYGGRVIFQQGGPEPLDAYRDFLREQEKKGAFKIVDKKYEADFWKYFTDEKMHTFYSKDEGEKFINTPWWLMDKPKQK